MKTRSAQGTGRFPWVLAAAGAALLGAAFFASSEGTPIRTKSSAARRDAATRTVAAPVDRTVVEAPRTSSHCETASQLGASGAVALPDEKGMAEIAVRTARKLWGDGATLFEAHTQLGPGGKPYTRLYLFWVGAPTETREEILAQLAAGVDPVKWDDKVQCLEMGAREDLPPIACRWAGLPPEILSHHEAVGRLRAKFGDRPYQLVRRHLSAAFPVLEYSDGASSYFCQPSTGKTSTGFALSEKEGVSGNAKYAAKLAGNRERWRRVIAESGR